MSDPSFAFKHMLHFRNQSCYIGWPVTGCFPDDFCKGLETLSPEGAWWCPAAFKCSSPQTQACFSPYLISSGALPAAKGVLQAGSALSSSVKLTPMSRQLTPQLAWCLFMFLQHHRHLMVHLHCWALKTAFTTCPLYKCYSSWERYPVRWEPRDTTKSHHTTNPTRDLLGKAQEGDFLCLGEVQQRTEQTLYRVSWL